MNLWRVCSKALLVTPCSLSWGFPQAGGERESSAVALTTAEQQRGAVGESMRESDGDVGGERAGAYCEQDLCSV